MYKNAQGEVLSNETCPECQAVLYSDPGRNDLDLWLHAFKYEAADKSWSYQTQIPSWADCEPGCASSLSPTMDPKKYMQLALEQARKCEPTSSAFSVGAVLVDADGNILEAGYSRELPGNTHAEQCALEKYFERTNQRDLVPVGTCIYTTMEPCSLRLSGNAPCVDRILSTRNLATVYVGVLEPTTFVAVNTGRQRLMDAKIKYIHVEGFEQECLAAARKGHDTPE